MSVSMTEIIKKAKHKWTPVEVGLIRKHIQQKKNLIALDE